MQAATQGPSTPRLTRTAPMFMRREREPSDAKRRRTGTGEAGAASPASAAPSDSQAASALRPPPPPTTPGAAAPAAPSLRERMEHLKPLAERMRPKSLTDFVVRPSNAPSIPCGR